ncbi:glycosyltransferase family 4 protein, partial [Oceanidesulfovibrio marinus]
AEAAVVVVPLRIGGGSRLKILEALAMRKVVLSTTLGAEGLDLIHGRHLQIEDDPGALAAECIDILRHPNHYTAMEAAGRDDVMNR